MSSSSDMSYARLLQRVHKGLSTIELIHTSHPRWPLPPSPSAALPPTLHVSVLDSSFNPPTLAHLALANTPPPPSADAPPGRAPRDFGARLLLLSVRNADKQLKPGDATYEQRMQMMVLLAHDLGRTHARSVPAAHAQTHAPASAHAQTHAPASAHAQTHAPASAHAQTHAPASAHAQTHAPASAHAQTHAPASASASDPALGEAEHEPNVAIALIDEPTFVGKSAILRAFLSSRIASLLSPGLLSAAFTPSPALAFLMGTDTAVRLFAPRYYASADAMRAALRRFLSPDGDDARIVCARRVSRGASREEEARVEAEVQAFARTIVPFERLAFVDIGEREAMYSSSEVRELRARGDERWRDMVTPKVADYIVANSLYVGS